jgi:hypothetical protein
MLLLTIGLIGRSLKLSPLSKNKDFVQGKKTKFIVIPAVQQGFLQPFHMASHNSPAGPISAA